DLPVKIPSLRTVQDARRKEELPEGKQEIPFRDQKTRYSPEGNQEIQGCVNTCQGCGGRANGKESSGYPPGNSKGHPPPSLYCPAPTAPAIPSATLKHRIQQHKMFGYHQFFLHHVHPALLRPGHQNGRGSGGGEDVRTKRHAKRRAPAHGELGLRVVRGFGSEGTHFLREARDGTPGSGPTHREDHDSRGIIWQNGDEDGHHDSHYYNRHYRDIATGRGGVRGVPGAAKAPAEPNTPREGKAAARVPPESPMGQWGPYSAREFPLQAPSSCTARARKCVDMSRIFAFSSTCSESCSISCFGSSSSTFSHSSCSRFFGFRGDLGSTGKSDIRRGRRSGRWRRRRRRRRKRKVIRRISEFSVRDPPRLVWKPPPLDSDDYPWLQLSAGTVAILDHPRSKLFEKPKWRTATSARARRRILLPQDEEAALPVALPPGSLTGHLFPCTINNIINIISPIPVSALIRFFLSFVVFHLGGGGEGVLFGSGFNGAKGEMMRLITQSKFVFPLLKHTNHSDSISVTAEGITTKGMRIRRARGEEFWAAQLYICVAFLYTFEADNNPYTERRCVCLAMGNNTSAPVSLVVLLGTNAWKRSIEKEARRRKTKKSEAYIID
ncbi:hypothetical protein C7212DRAFT_182865, partial [Tuber magnatum]